MGEDGFVGEGATSFENGAVRGAEIARGVGGIAFSEGSAWG